MTSTAIQPLTLYAQAPTPSAEPSRLLAEYAPVLMACYDALTLTCRYANRRYAEAFGRDESGIVGLTLGEVIGAEALEQIRPHLERLQQQGGTVNYERRLRAAGGADLWAAVSLVPHRGPDGGVETMLVLITDVTGYRDTELRLRESEERLGKFMHATAEGIVFHKDGYVTDANEPVLALTGYTLPELLGRRTLDFIAPDQVAKVSAVIASGQEVAYESALIHKDGFRIPVEFIVRTMAYQGESLRMTIVRDLRDRLAAQARIHHLAHHDPLTGMPNRVSFIEQLDHHLAHARQRHAAVALLFIDLDHFKRVNDSLGHLAGDALLQTVARRIRDCLGPHDVVARFGGDEFVVLLPESAGPGAVESMVLQLHTAISAPVEAEGRPISVTPSIGIALYPSDGLHPDELIKHADTAMYLAKAAGRATFRYFDARLAGMAYDALVVEGELAQAIERNEFELHFQPQLRLADGRLIGAEALIRWRHPSRGLLLPDEFIPVAEARRLMLPMGDWVLRRALRAARRWSERGLGAVPVAVNLSTVQFGAPGFVEAVATALEEEGVRGDLLEFELTERMLMDDLPAVHATLERVKRLGIRISLDDFGTGYTSMRHLKSLPIDKMKIDRSFVQDLPHDRGSAAIVRGLIDIGRGLGMSVVAEGVETEAQREFLASVGCDAVQGAGVGGAMTSAELEDWVRRGIPVGGGATPQQSF